MSGLNLNAENVHQSIRDAQYLAKSSSIPDPIHLSVRDYPVLQDIDGDIAYTLACNAYLSIEERINILHSDNEYSDILEPQALVLHCMWHIP